MPTLTVEVASYTSFFPGAFSSFAFTKSASALLLSVADPSAELDPCDVRIF